jgi:hypothetical protein
MADEKTWDETPDTEEPEENELAPDFANPKAPNPMPAEQPEHRGISDPATLDENGALKVAEGDEFKADRTGTGEEEAKTAEQESEQSKKERGL